MKSDIADELMFGHLLISIPIRFLHDRLSSFKTKSSICNPESTISCVKKIIEQF